MVRRTAVLLLPLLGSTGCDLFLPAAVTVELEPRMRVPPPLVSLDGTSRPVATARLAGGSHAEFVEEEVLFHPRNDADLKAFVARYGATIVQDGSKNTDWTGGWYLLKVDVARSPMDDLDRRLSGGRLRGRLRFSSDKGARLIALVAREAMAGRRIEANLIWSGQSTQEHPDSGSPGSFRNAETWDYMTEDDDPTTPAEEGLSVGVVHAWRYVDYASGAVRPRPTIAIIDGGFDLDKDGLPNNGNLDYTGDLTIKPQQFSLSTDFTRRDVIANGPHAGGANTWGCGDGNPCPWHGQEAFSVAAAMPNNRYGTAGSSGKFTKPLIIRAEASSYCVAEAIRGAAISSADVVSVSLSTCWDSWYCDTPFYDAVGMIDDAVKFANIWNKTIVLGSAGNSGKDISTSGPLPCATDRTLCVGTINRSKMNAYNYGSNVDIWAPDDLWATPTPADPDIHTFSGTSASTPFVAGIVALMKVLDRSVDWERARDVLAATANRSPDPRVRTGYVDAYRAVLAMKANQPPKVAIKSPVAGSSWPGRVTFTAEATDPESSQFNGTLHWLVDGTEVCKGLWCEKALAAGPHKVTARAVDPFGAEATADVNIVAIGDGRAPTLNLYKPKPGAKFHKGQLIDFRGAAVDPDGRDPITIDWSSSGAGALGSGELLHASLPPGHHTITMRATDGTGISATAQVEVDVDDVAGFPSPMILSPGYGFSLKPGTPLTLKGAGTDPENGRLSGQSLVWKSNRDGTLGTGETVTVTLTPTTMGCDGYVYHEITLTATDSNGHATSTMIVVAVGRLC